MLKFCSCSFFLISLATSCIQNKAADNVTALAAAKDSILQLTTNTAKNITAKGPIGWLDEFENSPKFYMATDGNLQFDNYQSADKFIKETLIKQIPNIKLQFSDIQATALSAEAGSVGANFKEELTDSTGKGMAFSGYFTATAHHTQAGWKYLNMHWSIKK